MALFRFKFTLQSSCKVILQLNRNPEYGEIFITLITKTFSQSLSFLCDYDVDKKDEFTGKVVKKTITYNTAQIKGTDNSLGEGYFCFNIRLMKSGEIKAFSVKLSTYTKYCINKNTEFLIKLENNKILKFKNKNPSVDCGDSSRAPNFFTTLSSEDVINLKNSPIKMLRLSLKKENIDSGDLVYPNLFIDKMNCIN